MTLLYSYSFNSWELINNDFVFFFFFKYQIGPVVHGHIANLPLS